MKMSAEFLCDPLDINMSSLKLGKTGRGRSSMVRLFRNKTPIQFKTGVMQSVYGVQENAFKKDDYYIDLTTTDSQFIDAINAVDSELITHISENLSLFDVQESLTREDISSSFLGINRTPNAFTIRLQMPGTFDFHVFDKNKCEMKIDKENIASIIPRNTRCKVIFELDRVWYFQNRFGIVCKLRQLKLEEDEEESTLSGNVSDASDAGDASEPETYLFID